MNDEDIPLQSDAITPSVGLPTTTTVILTDEPIAQTVFQSTTEKTEVGIFETFLF